MFTYETKSSPCQKWIRMSNHSIINLSNFYVFWIEEEPSISIFGKDKLGQTWTIEECEKLEDALEVLTKLFEKL